MSDEQIVVMSHVDGYFQAATDNAAGMASALKLARFFAERPRRDRQSGRHVAPSPPGEGALRAATGKVPAEPSDVGQAVGPAAIPHDR